MSDANGKLPMPEGKVIVELLGQLTGQAVSVKKPAAPIKLGPTVQTATYISQKDEILVICLCEIELAAYLGAALVVLPQRAAKEVADKGVLDGPAAGGFRECMNICAALLCSDSTPHVRFANNFPHPKAAGAEAMAVVTKPARRVDYRIDIEGYGGGGLAFLIKI
jgi:hypothetical protein